MNTKKQKRFDDLSPFTKVLVAVVTWWLLVCIIFCILIWFLMGDVYYNIKNNLINKERSNA